MLNYTSKCQDNEENLIKIQQVMGPLTFRTVQRQRDDVMQKLGFWKIFRFWIFGRTGQLASSRRISQCAQFSIPSSRLPGNGKLGFAENQKTRKPENQNQNQNQKPCRPKFTERSLGRNIWNFQNPSADLNSPCQTLPDQTLAFQLWRNSFFRVWLTTSLQKSAW